MSKNKNNWNGEFVQEYNILDSLCKRLSPRGDKTRSGIHNLEEALRKSNYKKAEELGYLRKYKNTTVSHRASKEMPSTPQEYVVFIRNLRCEVENNRGKYKTLFAQVEQEEAKRYVHRQNRDKKGQGPIKSNCDSHEQRTTESSGLPEIIVDNVKYWPSLNETGEWECAKEDKFIDDASDVFWTAYFPTIISCIFFLILYSCSTVWWWMAFINAGLSAGAIHFISAEIETKYNEFWNFDDLLDDGKHSAFSIGIMLLVDALAIGIDFIFKRNLFVVYFSIVVFLIFVVLYLINLFFLGGTDCGFFFRPYTINIMAAVAISLAASMSIAPLSWLPSHWAFVFIAHFTCTIVLIFLIVILFFINASFDDRR